MIITTVLFTERIAFKENDLCVTSGLSINGRLFITPREHLDALVCFLSNLSQQHMQLYSLNMTDLDGDGF